jgi:photosystem II stability/assembly factor-like uncharacterized protein
LSFFFFFTLNDTYSQWYIQKRLTEKNYLQHCFFIDSTHGWIINASSLYRFNGNDIIYESTPIIIGDDCYLSTFFFDSLNGWAVGGSINESNHQLSYFISQYKKGNWTVNTRDIGSILYTVTCIDTINCWAAGLNGVILKYNGTSWQAQTSGVPISINSLSFTDKNYGWAVGDDLVALNYQNGIWTQFPVTFPDSNYFYDFNSVSFVNKNLGWAVANRGYIYKFENNEWKINYQYPPRLNSIFFTDSLHGWAAGGGILRYENGVWKEQVNPVEPSMTAFQSVFFIDSLTGWIAGYRDILHTSNGGYTSVHKENEFKPSTRLLVFPNPFSSSANISFTISKPGYVELSIYDLNGRKLNILSSGLMSTGSYNKTIESNGLENGTYLLRLSSANSIVTCLLMVCN